MLKFFRKIRYDLMEKNKTGKYIKYALGEIVLVVIGILIALQINNWNNERKNSALEISILADLHQEFLQNRIQLDTVMFYNKRSYINCGKIISLFPIDINKNNLDTISYYLNISFWAYTFNPSQGSINSIISTSSFNIIQNKTLRNHLLSWNDLAGDLFEDENSAKIIVTENILPYMSKNFEWDYDFKDNRNNLKALETLEFEYLLKFRMASLQDIFKENGQLDKVNESLNKIIELTKPTNK